MTDPGRSFQDRSFQGRSEERDFFLDSLDDLEVEFAAGDLDEADYAALKADYTTRAAAAIRAAEREGPRSPQSSDSEGGRARTIIGVVAVVAVATLAGLLVTEFSGHRGINDTISGDIRTTTREMLVEAQQTFGSGDLEGAIDIYDDVLEIQPSNTDALAYKAWFLRLSGEVEAAQPLIEDAVVIDPDYADARVFATVIALDAGDTERAIAHLDAFDLLDAAPFIEQLVTGQGLRQRLAVAAQDWALGRVSDVLLVDDPPAFSASGLSLAEVLFAAEELATNGDVFAGLELIGIVIDAEPENVAALAGYGWLLGRSATPNEVGPAEVAVSFLDRAIAVDPAYPEALVYRAFVYAFLGQLEAGRADLAAFDAFDVRPADLRALIETFDLRGQLESS